ncbi:MAG: hypothetical protein KDI12_22360, partial [Anaerolineae bacterium]|nr:hypothetical protein [Anaerolineae bacterium]
MTKVLLFIGLACLVGVLVLGAKVVNDVGSARIVHDLETLGAVVLFIIGAVALTLAGGWSAARVNETRHAHKAQPLERQVIRETRILDGRTPGQPQILTVPGAFDMYPAQFAQEFGQQRAQVQHDAPAMLEA